MLDHFDAIYENGVLRPLEPLGLSEHQRVHVRVLPVSSEADDRVAAQRRAMEDLDAALADLPDCSPDDGFSAADHDQVIYGKSE